MERPVLDTHQKAHAINMDRRRYGILVEIYDQAALLETVTQMIHVKDLFRCA